jgi:hypothetical protein
MNKKCRHCRINIPLSRWSAHQRYYHAGTSVRPFGRSIEEIDSSVDAYIAAHLAEWRAPPIKPDCTYCGGPCMTVTACRQRRDRARQIDDMARRAAAVLVLEGTQDER